MSESTLTVDSIRVKRWKNKNGELHRLDGPSVEYPNGSKYWYENGLLHNANGYAAKDPDGSKYWYQHGQRHRIDGPAIQWADGHVTWYIEGRYLGIDLEGFWKLWKHLDEEQRQDVNLHIWLMKLRLN